MLTRRTFAFSLAGGTVMRGASKKTLGLELYSLRHLIQKDLPGTFAMARKMGFVDVEVPDLYGRTAAQMRGELDKADLKASSQIVRWADLNKSIDQVIRDAQALGVSYAVIPGFPNTYPLKPEEARTASDHFNKWAPVLQKSGLILAYHPHGFEFVPSTNGTLCDDMIRETAGSGMMFELDIFWSFHGGQDPTELLLRYPDRFPLVHIKDMEKGTPVNVQTGKAPDETSCVVGNGMIDYVKFFNAAEGKKIAHYFLEDEHPVAEKQIPESWKYLRRFGF